MKRQSTLGLGVALALLAGQALALLHLALVEHRRCPEHGETVHAAALSSDAGGAAAPSRLAGADHARADAAPEAGAEEQDEHCLAAALGSTSAELPRPVAAPAPPPTAPAVLASTATDVPPAQALPLLALAPKHGPPAADRSS